MIRFDKKIGGLEHFQTMINELGRDQSAKFLDIHRTTLDRILAGKTKLPRAYLIALYWETHWGQSVVDTHNYYINRLNLNRIESLERVIVQLERTIKTLIDESVFDSANLPVYRING